MGRCKVGGERLLSFFQKVLSDSQEKRHYLTNTRSICLSLSFSMHRNSSLLIPYSSYRRNSQLVTSFFIWYKPVTACLLLRSSQFETWTRKVSIRLVHFTYLLPRLLLFCRTSIFATSSSSSPGNCHFIPRKTGTISHHRFLRKAGFKLRRELKQYFLVN